MSIETVHAFCPNPSQERFEEMPDGKQHLSHFEGLPTVAAIGDLGAIEVTCQDQGSEGR